MIATQNGLPENNVHALQPDRKGDIWAGSYQGISRIDRSGKVIEWYNRKNGLNFVDFYSPFTITNEGKILTGIGNGFIQFQPDSLPYKSPAFPIVLTGINPDDPSEVARLSYANNGIQFEFAALSFINPSQTRYEYRLNGSDKEWVQAGNLTSVRYNNLNAGTYRFEVKAIDFTGRRSSNTASWSFTVLPPWWQSWWFRIVSAILIIGVAALLMVQWIRRIKAKAAIRQEMAELRGRALRAQMNPHFIFNCLNAIQELIVREQYTESFTYLSKFSRLLRMVLDMSEKNFIPLSNELEMCQLYVELEAMRFRNSFTYSIEVEENMDTDSIRLPSLLMQPFIENAIWHGLLQKEGEKKLWIRFSEKEGKLYCEVEDNGIGRKRAAEIKSKKLGAQNFESKGMLMAQQRIENLQSDGLPGISLEIRDCRDEQGNATGTLIQIIIP